MGCAASYCLALGLFVISVLLFHHQTHVNDTMTFTGPGLANPMEFGFAILGGLAALAGGFFLTPPFFAFRRLGSAAMILLSATGMIVTSHVRFFADA